MKGSNGAALGETNMTITLYHITETSTGADLGYYEGRTPDEAIRAFRADPEAPKIDAATELSLEEEEYYEGIDAEEEELLVRRNRAYNS